MHLFILAQRNWHHMSPSLATGFSAAFPGIRPHLLTLTSNFKIPIYRDILLALGVCSVSKESCSNILKAGPGSAITIVVGGATESLRAHPGTADLTLRRRCAHWYLEFRGILTSCAVWALSRLQYDTGMTCSFMLSTLFHVRNSADLVPVFSFGENDVRSLILSPHIMCRLMRYRYFNKCRTKKVQRCMLFKSDFKISLGSLCHYFMDVDCWIVGHGDSSFYRSLIVTTSQIILELCHIAGGS